MTRYVFLATLAGLMAQHSILLAADVPATAILRADAETGFANAGWKYDRYPDLPSLDARKAMTVADLEGPGIIRQIHTTRHQPKEMAEMPGFRPCPEHHIREAKYQAQRERETSRRQALAEGREVYDAGMQLRK